MANRMSKSKDEALKQYIAAVEEAAENAAEITRWLDDYGEVGPDDVNWASVGSMMHVLEDLKGIVSFITNGER